MQESGAVALLLPATDSHKRTPGLFKTECLGKKIIAKSKCNCRENDPLNEKESTLKILIWCHEKIYNDLFKDQGFIILNRATVTNEQALYKIYQNTGFL